MKRDRDDFFVLRNTGSPATSARESFYRNQPVALRVRPRQVCAILESQTWVLPVPSLETYDDRCDVHNLRGRFSAEALSVAV